MARLNVNGETIDIDVDASTPLLRALREQLGPTGTKYSCGIGLSGACSVLIDGETVRACVVPASALGETQRITTIEGLSPDGSHALQQAGQELDVPRCGYCQPGMIMNAAAIFAATGKRIRRFPLSNADLRPA